MRVANYALPFIIEQLSGSEQRLLAGLIESELMNGMALVPLSLETEARALVDKCAKLLAGRDIGTCAPGATANTTLHR